MRYALAAVLLLNACSLQQPSPPTSAEAEAFLTHVVDVAQSGNFNALCELGGGSCEDFLNEQGGQEVPREAPEVVGGRIVQPTGDGAGRVGGFVLELCGTNARGEPYYSEMLVFSDFNGDLKAIEPTYWMGIRIADDNEAGLDIDANPAAECS